MGTPLKKYPDADLDWMSNLGHANYQLWYSAKIIAAPEYPDRLVEAYKWVFIAWFLGEPGAEEVSHFLRSAMLEAEAERSVSLAEEWLDNACESIRKGCDKGWSKQMLRLAAGDLLPHQCLESCT